MIRVHIFKGVLLIILLASITAPDSMAKPVMGDGFPTGQETPEGVASDFARAFIQQDDALYRRLCIPSLGAAKVRSEYLKFFDGTSQALRLAKKDNKPSPNRSQ
ncbi:MAG: hypothetical protein JWO13_1520 [Acidobacteriales bacterium]|nr:hypothetical protein [Terriglobales bacterium]